ncbi:MAG: TonB-dependent receptor [Longimicrobiales bacterium]
MVMVMVMVMATAVAIGAVWPAAAAGQSTDALLDRPANLDVDDVSVADGLRALQRASGVSIAFSPDLVPSDRRIGCPCREMTVGEALSRILEGTGLEWREARRQVLVGRPGSAMGPAATTVVGMVVEGETGRPVPAADIVIDGGRRLLTGSDGRFTVRGVAPGSTVRLSVEALGYEPARAEVSADGGVGGVRVALTRAPLPLSEIVIAPGSFGVLDATPTAAGVTISRDDIEAIPQFGDDAFRTLKRMPGVSSDDVSTRLNVRGGTSRDLLVRLDGLELFEPYHLKDLDGAFGIVDVQSLGSIDLVTGGFPVEYGDKTAGIFDMHTRRPPPTGTRTTLGLSLSSMSAISQGHFADGRGQWLGALRRGFLEYVLSVTGVDDDLSPSYWDALGRAHVLLGDRHAVSAQFLYAGDDMRWNDDETGSGVRSRWTNGYGWLTWRGRPTDGLDVETLVSVGRLSRDRTGATNNVGRGEFSPLTTDVNDQATVDFAGIRQEMSVDLTPDLLVKIGGEFRTSVADYDYRAASTRYALDSDDRLFIDADSVRVVADPDGDELAGWAALRGRTGPFAWEGGLRFDRHTVTDDNRWSPRLMARWDPGSGTSVKASWGRYAQSQGIHELEVADGQSVLAPAETSEQMAVGVEHRTAGGWAFRLEAYDRQVDDPLPEWVNLSREINPIPEVESDRTRIQGAEARARGIEALVALEDAGPFSGSVAYALASAENRIDGAWRPRTLDQRHTLNLFGSVRLGGAWQLSGAWQYHTGWPFTEQFLDVVVTEGIDGVEEVEVVRRGFGTLNAGRLPAYHRLDLRVTRRFQMDRSLLEVYLDVFNAYNRTNLRGWEWRLRDHGDGTFGAQRDPGEEQLPLMPTLGVRWVF